MPVLHLGVTDVPYVNPPQPVKRGRKPKNQQTPNETTGDVAEILENKYHVMRIFYEQNEKEIADNLSTALASALENVLIRAPSTTAPFAQAAAKIETRFKRFLSDKEMDRLGYPGIPTAASLKGTSHRVKGKRGSPRPSFIDTGLYEQSFKAWVE